MLSSPNFIGVDAGSTFGEITVIQTPHATKEHWNFKPSRHRSKRLHKKLSKRFGGQVVVKPSLFQLNGRLYAHPEIVEGLKAEAQRNSLTNKGPES